MPTISIHFTPSRRKKSGITSMKATSDIWPRLCLAAAFSSPLSFRNGFVKL